MLGELQVCRTVKKSDFAIEVDEFYSGFLQIVFDELFSGAHARRDFSDFVAFDAEILCLAEARQGTGGGARREIIFAGSSTTWRQAISQIVSIWKLINS